MFSIAERNNTEPAQYVDEIKRRADAFIHSRELEGREELVERIKLACNTSGVTLLLGGMDTGKSHILNNVTAELNSDATKFVVMWDAREYSTFLDAAAYDVAKKVAVVDAKTKKVSVDKTARALASLGLSESRRVGDFVRKLVDDRVSLVFNNAEEDDASTITTSAQLAATIAKEAVSRNVLPVLVIDHPDLLLEDNDADSLELLHMLANQTKEENQISVLLAPVDQAFSFALRERFGLNLTDRT
ncbi:MAG: hypothetical protein AAF004_15605, partial [Pseudomonadota bacterium]